MRIAGWTTSLIVVLAVGSAGQGSAPPPRRLPPPGTTATSSATQPASPVAVMTWITRYGSDGMHALELLVVWRGQPGWFITRGPNSSSGGGSGSAFHSTSRFGELELRLELDRATRVAVVQGQRLELGDRNVVLVDDVDQRSASIVPRVLRVDGAVAPGGDGRPDIDAVLMRSADIVSFLRCEVPLPGGKGPSFVSPTCARLASAAPRAEP